MTLHKSHNLLVIDFAFPICQRAKVKVYKYQGSRTKMIIQLIQLQMLRIRSYWPDANI
jgi:hypothetical protein